MSTAPLLAVTCRYLPLLAATLQVIDEHGTKLQPAWSNFVSYCGTNITGSTPDHLHYKEATPAPTVAASITVLPQESTGSNSLWSRLGCAMQPSARNGQ